MKALTKKQQKMADRAVSILKKLQEEGVVSMIVDGGGGNSGLTFWRPTAEEDDEAYEIILAAYGHPKHEEFEEKMYHPRVSVGLRLDVIAL